MTKTEIKLKEERWRRDLEIIDGDTDLIGSEESDIVASYSRFGPNLTVDETSTLESVGKSEEEKPFNIHNKILNIHSTAINEPECCAQSSDRNVTGYSFGVIDCR